MTRGAVTIKKYIITLTIIAITLSGVLVTGLLTDRKERNNKISYGDNDIRIDETFEPKETYEPGTIIPKVVTVKNTKGTDCYVRVCVSFSDERFQDSLLINYNEQWQLHEEDGFYYYPEVLKEGQTTLPLFTTVELKDNISLSESQSISQMDMIIYSESCQKGNAQNYIDAWNQMNKNKNTKHEIR